MGRADQHRRPTKWTSTSSPRSAMSRRANSAWCGLNAATAKRAFGTRRRTRLGRVKERRQFCRTSWVREPGESSPVGAGRPPIAQRRRRRTSACASRRSTDGRRTRPGSRGRGPSFFERQAAKHIVDKAPHFFDAVSRPGPNLRRGVIEDRDAVNLGPMGDPPIEARIIDQHDGIRPWWRK